MPRRDPLLEQAALEASLKLGPQGNALRSLLSDLAGQYSRTRKVNASNAAGIAEATRQARPEVGGAFDQALSSVSAQRAALGASGDPQAAAYQRRVGEQKANALNELSGRELRATEGRVFANQTAREEYLGGKQKIISQLQDLAGQEGAETAASYGRLRESQRDRAVTTRGQTLSSADRQASLTETQRHNQASEQIAAQRAGAKKPKLATTQAHTKAKDSIDEARRWITRLSQGSSTSTQIRDLLETGGSVDVGQPEPLKIPKFSKDFINAAYDLQFNGGLSKANIKALHRRRLSVKQLGYPTLRVGDHVQVDIGHPNP